MLHRVNSVLRIINSSLDRFPGQLTGDAIGQLFYEVGDINWPSAGKYQQLDQECFEFFAGARPGVQGPVLVAKHLGQEHSPRQCIQRAGFPLGVSIGIDLDEWTCGFEHTGWPLGLTCSVIELPQRGQRQLERLTGSFDFPKLGIIKLRNAI